MKVFVLLVVGVIFIAGCATPAKDLNRISLGMSKLEVISILGEPSETRASAGVEYMIYALSSTGTKAKVGCGVAGVVTLGLAYSAEGCKSSTNDYFVRFKESKVSAYGRIGDFDSTQNPEATININKTEREVR